MEVNKGQVLMSLDTKDVNIFYKVDKVYQDDSGASWIRMHSLTNGGKYESEPVLFLDKKYIQVSETTAKILFGSKL